MQSHQINAEKILLTADAGATHTRALIATVEGRILGARVIVAGIRGYLKDSPVSVGSAVTKMALKSQQAAIKKRKKKEKLGWSVSS